GPILVAKTGTVTFSNQFDPSTADTLAGFTYDYDLDGNGSFEITGSTQASQPVGPFALPGNYVISGRIHDKDGGVTTYSTSLQVNNVQVIIVSGNNDPVVRVYDSITRALKFSITPFGAGYFGGIHSASGDVTGDQVPDIILTQGRMGYPVVSVYNGLNGQLVR